MPKRLTVGDFMTTALITMKPSDTLKHADVDMRLAAIRHIPVVDERGRLVGILSNRDVLRALAQNGAPTAIRIGEIMTRRVRTCTPRTSAAQAAEIMIEHKIGALPVIGEEGQLVGLVTESDFVRLVGDSRFS
jgi:CBS domain-containing protein